ncbi:MAG: phenylalanine--tRNA ligase subunit alpha [Flavobacteriales bacterium]|nr:phenylalanine--tRNA ligase subunit alpha [Flavobacteriales bacterium]|tara:strand:+ start:4254 stop:5273 length:1020 start_codon:yes stop_codon:yes gene_type:complete
MENKIKEIDLQIEKFKIEDSESLEKFRIQFLGSKNILKDLFAEIKNVAPEKRKDIGKSINSLKNKAQTKLEAFNEKINEDDQENVKIDLTLPGENLKLGSRHPLSLVNEKIIDIFGKIGFTVSEGPEVEDDWHNFTGLNLPQEHPARDMQDTFFIEKSPDWLLRTHTSSVQMRVMESNELPIRTITPGRVYRNEAISARAHCFFHQVEGLYIDENVSFADLKQTIQYFAQEMFGKSSKIRLRPSYFPFTEPSAEVDVSCSLCEKEGCNVCKYTGWLEIMGCGMIDPNVLSNAGIDPEKYSGFAFGMGVERMAMLKYEVKDLRMWSENDIRFLEQFKSAW